MRAAGGRRWARVARAAALVLAGDRRRAVRPERRGHRRAELPGRRAEDLLRPVPVRDGRRARGHLRQQRHLDDHRPPRPARRGRATRPGDAPHRARAAGGRRSRPRSGGTSTTSGSAASAARCRTSSRPSWPWPRSWSSGRARRDGWLARRRAGRLLALLHLDDPGQLVRRRRHAGQPLLPEPAAAGAVPASRAGASRWWRWRARVVSARLPAGRCGSRRIRHSLRPGDHATVQPVPRASRPS